MEFHRLKLIDKITNLTFPNDFRPIARYLVFGDLLDNFNELSEHERNKIDRLAKEIKIYKTVEDFHMESINKINIPNRIVDLVLIGPSNLVNERRIQLSRQRRILRKKLMYRLNRIKDYFLSKSDLPIMCLAYRGELSMRGRFPHDDIDLVISCNRYEDYKSIKLNMLVIAKKLKFRKVDWIEMHPNKYTQTKSAIFEDLNGLYRLDCYATLGEQELLRIKNESPVEALWVLGVLKHSKSILNHSFFRKYIDHFEDEVRRHHKFSF